MLQTIFFGFYQCYGVKRIFQNLPSKIESFHQFFNNAISAFYWQLWEGIFLYSSHSSFLLIAVSIHTTEILALKIFHVVDKQCLISKNSLPHRQCNALLENTGSMEQIKSPWALFNLMVHHKNR